MNRTAGTPSTNGPIGPSSSVPCRSTSHWVGLARSPPEGGLAVAASISTFSLSKKDLPPGGAIDRVITPGLSGSQTRKWILPRGRATRAAASMADSGAGLAAA